VFQVMKRHFARYTPEMVEQVSGVPPDLFAQVCELITGNSGRDPRPRSSTAWAGLSTPSACSTSAPRRSCRRCSATWPAGGGILALRGHASIQGSGAALTRFGVFEAGRASARDPKYTVGPQRQRLREQGERAS
jgi:formate dehydrogenase major subunit